MSLVTMLCFTEEEIEKLKAGETIERTYTGRLDPRQFPDHEHIPVTTSSGSYDDKDGMLVRIVGVSSRQRGHGRKRVHMDFIYIFERSG